MKKVPISVSWNKSLKWNEFWVKQIFMSGWLSAILFLFLFSEMKFWSEGCDRLINCRQIFECHPTLAASNVGIRRPLWRPWMIINSSQSWAETCTGIECGQTSRESVNHGGAFYRTVASVAFVLEHHLAPVESRLLVLFGWTRQFSCCWFCTFPKLLSLV